MLSSLRSNPFPASHNQPLHLTIKEIADPQEVFDNFFSAWSLTQVRFIMKEWLYEAYSTEMGAQKEVLFMHDELVRLVEAVWVLQEAKGETINTIK